MAAAQIWPSSQFHSSIYYFAAFACLFASLTLFSMFCPLLPRTFLSRKTELNWLVIPLCQWWLFFLFFFFFFPPFFAHYYCAIEHLSWHSFNTLKLQAEKGENGKMGRGHQCLRSKEEDEPKSRRHQSLMLRWVAHSHTSFFFCRVLLSKRKKCMLGIFSASLLAPILSMKVFTYRNYLLLFFLVFFSAVFFFSFSVDLSLFLTVRTLCCTADNW